MCLYHYTDTLSSKTDKHVFHSTSYHQKQMCIYFTYTLFFDKVKDDFYERTKLHSERTSRTLGIVYTFHVSYHFRYDKRYRHSLKTLFMSGIHSECTYCTFTYKEIFTIHLAILEEISQS